MKLKIIHQSQEIRDSDEEEQEQENRDGGDGEEEQSMKEEAVEMEEPQMEEDDEENSPVLAPCPISAFPLLVSGKRKRKPKELFDEGSPIIRRKKTKSPASKSEQGTPNSGGASISKGDAQRSSVQVKSPTVIRAEEFQSGLGSDHPTFMKVLVRSHVASCFWMGLPVPFCKIHLPSVDSTVILEDENGEEFSIKYIAHKTGLSAGWRKFVSGNKLLEGDVLIYQLTEPCRFKVYVIRANDLTEVDGALSLLILDSQTKQNDAVHTEGTITAQSKKKRRPKSLPLTIVQQKNSNEPTQQPSEHSGNDSDEVASEVLEGPGSSSPQFKDVKTFEDFHIVINGTCIDSELPETTRRKYYELCCSKNAFLHDQILPGLYSKLAAGVIFEAMTIVDAIKECKLTTEKKDFEVWEKSLRSFELLGLTVGFLRARLNRLMSLAFETEGAAEIRRFWEVQKVRDSTVDEIRKLEEKIVELKELCERCDEEMGDLKMRVESYEVEFQEEVNKPW